MTAFIRYQFEGADAQKFLQGQVTLHVERMANESTRYTGICDLKGRIQFGLWLKKVSAEHFEITVTQDQSEVFSQHIKKYGAFSKISLTQPQTVYPIFHDQYTHFSTELSSIEAWENLAITHGLAWITSETAHLFQPQELRLHQRDGVHYDKGCYLGQEIVARLWFKAKPKSWLHLIEGNTQCPAPATQLHKNIQVVNSIATETGFKALVIAKPDVLAESEFKVLNLPQSLNGDVARPQ